LIVNVKIASGDPHTWCTWCIKWLWMDCIL
jgi:hypothetical protein